MSPWSLLFIFALFTPTRATPPLSRIAYVGNSYTSTNDLPSVVNAILLSAFPGRGAAPTTQSSTPGGYRFSQHLTYAATLSLVDQGSWDVVVLQDQSQWPAFAEAFDGNREEFLAGARGMCSRIRQRNPNAAIYFYGVPL